MRNAFRAKWKLGFLDGSITIPEDKAGIEDWYTVNSMAVGWLMSSIEPNLRHTIAYLDTVQDLWKDLQTRFEAGDDMRFHELKQALQECKQGGDNVTMYFGRLKTIWDDYDGYRKIPKCTCGGCKCNLEKQFLESVEKEKIHEFLLGLDGRVYGTLRSNLLSTTELPTLNKVYNIILQEERLQKVTRGQADVQEAAAFAMRTGGKWQSTPAKDKSKLMCSYCKKGGHERDSYFKLTGQYPEWWKGNKGGNGKEKIGSLTKEGGRRTPGVQANAVGTIPEGEGSSHPDPKEFPTFTVDQWNSLLEFMKKYKAGDNLEKLSGPHFEDADWSG
ncbi:unnamed protein product [Cuscuta epithymum]|uniref:Retrotransposon gag domain-containing protein n=1 Tax=Cuscuta epithymum TaxID=186058 RepID=A0AAV0DCE1_9ASTE|nr:unnamed protein product [Cuscuta epithymum]